MSISSDIEWTEATWNPLTGCSKVSIGCLNCYAERMAKRLKAIGHPNYIDGFSLKMHEDTLSLPLQWRKPRKIFVNSMSDLFHEDASDDFILRTFDVMNEANWHIFQILTKRTERLLSLTKNIDWQPHIWMGVSVETNDYQYRINYLRETNAHVKFVSFEPLLGDFKQIDLFGIDWVIVGGESGPKARPVDASWVLNIRNHCHYQRTPFFFKQWGGRSKKKSGRLLEGKTWSEMPLSFAARH